MAHAGRPASRHGTYDAFRTELASEAAADELPSQSVFSYDGTEEVRQARENPTLHQRRSTGSRSMSHRVIPSGPVVAMHMFDASSDKSVPRESSPRQTKGRHQWSREGLDGSSGFPPASPRPPSTPRSSRPGSMRRRSLNGQRPPSEKWQRSSSARKSSRDFCPEQEDVLPPMTILRPQSSLGKYAVLPSISPTPDKLLPNFSTSRSDGSKDQRGTEEMQHLTSRMAHQVLVETSLQTSRDSLQDHPISRDTKDKGHHLEYPGSNLTQSDFQPSAASTNTAVDTYPLRHSSSSASSSASQEPVNDRSHTSLSQYKMDEASQPSDEGQVLLGVKIPTDGTRHKHHFNQRDQLRCIILFAEEISGEDFSNHVLVLATSHRRLDNLSQTIQAAGLESKSVLHLEELD